MNNRAVLLANLGSPDAPDVPSLRRYLNQFLMDPYVIPQPWLLRRLIVSLLVLPTRPKHSAAAYQSVWMEDGSPLLVLSMRLLKALQQKTDMPISMAMRYGKPSIKSELLKLSGQEGITEILFIPLYPHYAESTVLTSIKAAEQVIKAAGLKVKLIPHKPFYDNDTYINALHSSTLPWLKDPDSIEHILFSFHGLPEQHILSADPSGQHCLQSPDCCSTPSPVHETCYRHQVLTTTRSFVAKAGLKPEQYSISFQSRLGRQKWLEPSTENTLQELAKKGIKNLLVMCPAFVTDCLETLEEIEIQGAESFKQAGGESLTLIPCLNDHPEWVDTLIDWFDQEN